MRCSANNISLTVLEIDGEPDLQISQTQNGNERELGPHIYLQSPNHWQWK
jgi:hypothetical protein